MDEHLDILQRKADDLSRMKELMEGALTDLHQVLSDMAKDANDARARAMGQRDLPLPGTPAAAVALVAEPALTRAAILGELDALDDALNRGDTDRARSAIWNLRDALTHIHESA